MKKDKEFKSLVTDETREKMRKLREYASKRPCGTRAKYVSGCRCTQCRAANSRYQTEREARVREGRVNPLVDAAPAREHLRKLSKRGIGYKTVAEYSGVGKSTLLLVMTGGRTKVRKANLDAVLAVDAKCFSGGTLLKAGETWRRINWMLEEGFTKREIAKRLGAKTPALQIRRNRVTGKTAVRVERLERLIRMGE